MRGWEEEIQHSSVAINKYLKHHSCGIIILKLFFSRQPETSELLKPLSISAYRRQTLKCTNTTLAKSVFPLKITSASSGFPNTIYI